jgi:hypothetical protein
MPPRSYGGQVSPGQSAPASNGDDGDDADDGVIAGLVGPVGAGLIAQAQRVSASTTDATADTLMGRRVRDAEAAVKAGR